MRHRGLLAFGIGLVAALSVGWFVVPRALYETVEQPLQFNHKLHVGESVGMACQDCHALEESGRFTGVPAIAVCEPCHADLMGETANEKLLVEEYVAQGREIPWLVYARQPENVWFSHSMHVNLAQLACEECHGPHGGTEELRPFERNRISTYSRDIWGPSASRLRRAEWEGMKMSDCSGCHRERRVAESCLTCHK